jgi:hypothetical protein
MAPFLLTVWEYCLFVFLIVAILFALFVLIVLLSEVLS